MTLFPYPTGVPVPFFDLKKQYQSLDAEIRPALEKFLPQQAFILGPTVESFEKSLATYCQTPFSIGLSSGTDALLLALEALHIGPGDEVIVPSFTFYCTASVVARRGAKPVFVDVDLHDYNILPAAIEAAITSRTKAMIPVHLFGQIVQIEAIQKIAQNHSIPIIEDSAQGIGAEYKGKRAGSFGRFGAFSFFPTKNLGAFGDGGALTLSSPEDLEHAKILRMHGSRIRYQHEEIGGCFRLDALQALILEIKLRHLESWQEKRRQNAAFYNESLQGVGEIVTPVENKDCRHVYHQYVIRTSKRDELRAHLTSLGIGSEVYYPTPVHLQKSMEYLGHRLGSFPNSERLAQEVLALPIYPELEKSHLEEAVNGIRQFFGK
jgi:dTDP-4-amino-4,6-dideoxygalactose transaminase